LILEKINKDGKCSPISLTAKVGKMWGNGKTISGFNVKFTASNFPKSPSDQAQLINDWSRVKLESLKWFNKVSNKYVPLAVPAKMKNNQFFDSSSINIQQNTWRFMFKDDQSRILSNMAVNDRKIEYSLWLKIARPIPADEKMSDFELEVMNAQLCDGGFDDTNRVVIDEPKNAKPAECAAVSSSVIKNNYNKPSNGQSMAQLFIQAAKGVLGCEPYLIIGFDAPRTTLILPQNEVKVRVQHI
jgi:hypothetical protein